VKVGRGGRRTSAVAAAVLICFACLSVSACRSAFVETTVENDGATPVQLVEVDYPSASFGMQTLGAQSTYHYHFKVQGSGPITITFVDNAGKPHTATGPTLSQGQQGTLKITIDQAAGVSWGANLSGGGH
jgi:hypothetical protein